MIRLSLRQFRAQGWVAIGLLWTFSGCSAARSCSSERSVSVWYSSQVSSLKWLQPLIVKPKSSSTTTAPASRRPNVNASCAASNAALASPPPAADSAWPSSKQRPTATAEDCPWAPPNSAASTHESASKPFSARAKAARGCRRARSPRLPTVCITRHSTRGHLPLPFAFVEQADAARSRCIARRQVARPAVVGVRLSVGVNGRGAIAVAGRVARCVLLSAGWSARTSAWIASLAYLMLTPSGWPPAFLLSWIMRFG